MDGLSPGILDDNHDEHTSGQLDMDQHRQPGDDTNSPVPPDTSVFVDNSPEAEPMLAANGINTGIQPGDIKDL